MNNFNSESQKEGESREELLLEENKELDTTNESIETESIHQRNMRRMGKFFLQVGLLMKKNYLLFKRNLKITLFQIITPIFFTVLLVYLQWIAKSMSSFENKNPGVENVPLIPKCFGEDCITIGYGIIGEEANSSAHYDWIRHSMAYLAKENHLEYGVDVRQLVLGQSEDFMNYIMTHQNKTFIAVLFCTSQWNVMDVKVPCKFDEIDMELKLYALYFNYTLAPDVFLSNPIMPGPVFQPMLKVKLDIDNGMLEYFALKENLQIKPKIEVTTSNYPSPPDRLFEGIDLVSMSGPSFFFFTPMVTFMIMLTEIVREKQNKLRHGLSVMGLKSTPFWVSWFLTGLAFSVISVLVLIIMGLICQIDFFLNTPFIVIFALFVFFSMSMVMLALFISTVVSHQKTAYAVSYGFLLAGIVMQVILSNPMMIYLIFYPEDVAGHTYFIRTLFALYPPFSFSKMFGDISQVCASHYSPEDFVWVEGRDYEYADLFREMKGTLLFGDKYISPAPIWSLGLLCVNGFIFGVLAWYFDHVIEENRGTKQSPLFFLTKSFWGCKSKKKLPIENISELMDIANQTENINDIDTVQHEREKVLIQEREGNVNENGIRIIGIQKNYPKYPFGIKSDKDVQALKGVYLEVDSGELLSILGHNGAGKSTLITILTGLQSGSSGSARVCGIDIRENIKAVQQLVGLVPQFDILWDELTAREHLEMYSKLKRLPKKQIKDSVTKILEEVNLGDVGGHLVKTFSGGMKRRLSVAISGIGDPKVIIMDEPTTGMDPISKRSVWGVIQKLKQKKCFILTTHAMEEADVLSDRIAVIVDGQFKCIGTPLFLKTRYGHGYRVTLVTQTPNVERVIALMKLVCPSATIQDESAGSIMFSVGFHNLQELTYIFMLMDHNEKTEIGDLLSEGEERKEERLYDYGGKEEEIKELKELVKDCGVSHATLEEVFMRGKKRRRNLRSRAKRRL